MSTRKTPFELYLQKKDELRLWQGRYQNILKAFHEAQGFDAVTLGTDTYFSLPESHQYACDVFWNHQVTNEVLQGLEQSRDWADFYFDLYAARVAH